ncbi:MAG: LiaF-related protein, partial [Gammaproteobacteria bacterium]|nr:LiaF-related protein [Gammaproteobacteria bacterium]
KLHVVAVMGGVDLDFREAVFGPGVSEVKVTAVMGAIAVIVPPHLQVEFGGTSIMGAFEGLVAGSRDASAPLLRITGSAVMGAVEISTRPLGKAMKSDDSASVGQIGKR